MNKGWIVNHASAGKKCMGTVRPGNSSGLLILNGSETEIGNITLANERIVKLRLKSISAFFLSVLLNAQYPAAATMQANTLMPISAGIFTSFEKSTSVAKKYIRL